MIQPTLTADEVRAMRTSELIACYVALVTALNLDPQGEEFGAEEHALLCANIILLRDEIDRRLPQAGS